MILKYLRVSEIFITINLNLFIGLGRFPEIDEFKTLKRICNLSEPRSTFGLKVRLLSSEGYRRMRTTLYFKEYPKLGHDGDR